MKNLEFFEINYRGKIYKNIIAQKLGIFLFYKSIRKPCSFVIFDEIKVTRKIQ
nr:hypothetical protein KUHPSE09_00350 [Staphylococcus epidermidis]